MGWAIVSRFLSSFDLDQSLPIPYLHVDLSCHVLLARLTYSPSPDSWLPRCLSAIVRSVGGREALSTSVDGSSFDPEDPQLES